MWQIKTAEGVPRPLWGHRLFADLVGGPGKGVRKRLSDAGLRDWEVDFCWKEAGLIVEVEGGSWVRGSHVRGKRFESDCEKYNELELRGWTLIRVTTNMVSDGRALSYIERFFDGF